MKSYQIYQGRKNRKKRSWIKAVRTAQNYEGTCRKKSRGAVAARAPKPALEAIVPPVRMNDPWMRSRWTEASDVMRGLVRGLMEGVQENVEGLAQELGLAVLRMVMEGERTRRLDGP